MGIKSKLVENDKKGKYHTTIIVYVIAILLAVFVRMFVFDVAIVRGESMENTFIDGQRVSYYKLSKPEKGDVVIVKSGSKTLIKRLIATEGDTIEIQDGIVYLNGEILKEEYIKEEMDHQNLNKMTLKEGDLFVMGDNRNRSNDSRDLGLYNLKDDYKGKVFLKYKLFDTFEIIK